MKLVDFHCHLDLYPNHEEIIREADQAGVYTLAVTTTPRAWPRNNELAKQTKHVRTALGLHPQLVAEHEHEISIWDKYLPEAKYIGEVGLDASPRFYKSMLAQQRVFQHVLQQCAKYGDKVLSVHSVRTAKQILDNIEQYLPAGSGKVVLHWFTGSKSEAMRAIKLGCYFSVNATMLQNKRHQDMIKGIPLDRILTETDGPFTQVYGSPARPWDVVHAVQGLSELHGVTIEETACLIVNNFKTLLD